MRDELATLTQLLIEGEFETPLWDSFLQRLRMITGAKVATLVYQSPRDQVDEAQYLMAGAAMPQSAQESFRRYHYPDNPLRRLQSEEGQPYSLARLIELDGKRYPEFFDHFVVELGMTDVRRMRVQEASGVDAWLSLTRQGGYFCDRDTALLADLAPALRAVMRSHIASERHRFAAEISAEAVRRTPFGWISLDKEGMVLDADLFGRQMLETSGILCQDAAGQLGVSGTERQEELIRAIAELAGGSSTRPRAINLRSDPWLDVLLVRAPHRHISAEGTAAVIAYVHGDNWSSLDREKQLSDLFGLGRSEAQLALAICQGKSIAEAAVDLGVTVSTARTYSKIIYAKTGARGQADLVRIVLRSAVALTTTG